MSAFSRLQLAAALLEYDNDPDNPDGQFVNAKESAIFAHLRRPPPPPRRVQDEDTDDDEDVPLQQSRARNTTVSGARSRSVDNRQSMAASVVNLGEDEPDEDEEVLSSWGLDGFVEKKDRTSKVIDTSAGLAASERLAGPRAPASPLDQLVHNTSPIPRPRSERPRSTGGINEVVIGESPERSRLPPTSIEYRKSMNAALDFAVSTTSGAAEAENEPGAVQFPSTATPQRTPGLETPNPFEVALPSPDRLSRFDPKAQRRQSVASVGLLSEAFDGKSQNLHDSDHEPAEGLSAVGNAPRARVASLGTMGTQQMLDVEASPLPSPGEPEHKRLSRLDLLRPKVLVMPTPLQDQQPKPKKIARDGFFQTEDGGLPLPPGSRTEARPGIRPLSTLNPSASYNPRISMSLSQLTFRQSLMVGGARDPSYADIERALKVATNDGEQIEQEWSEEDEPDRELRPPGKLYGKSLIDDLEARKATLKGKQRVFTGDNRPSMMQRSTSRPDTLIDPNSLSSRPTTQYLHPTQVQEEIRRKRASGIPLVSFDSEPALAPPRAAAGLPQTRSVFGVDKVWERELAKLKAAEESEKTEQAKLDALEARMEDKRRGATGNAPAALEPDFGPAVGSEGRPTMGSRRESTASLGARGWFNSPESEADEGEGLDRRSSIASQLKAPAFSRKVSDAPRLPQIPSGELDSDEEDVPLAQQIAKRGPGSRQNSRPTPASESDSDEDKPIAALKRRQSKASAPDLGLPPINFDGPSSAGATGESLQEGKDAESSEDELPLGVKHPSFNRLSSVPSGVPPKPAGGGDSDEDDKPLGVKYSGSTANVQGGAQALQQQQQMFMQQQMLQQQMMMRASMAFGGSMMNMNPAMMGAAGFASPFGAPAMSMNSLNLGTLQQAAQEAHSAQHSRVESWRRDVV